MLANAGDTMLELNMSQLQRHPNTHDDNNQPANNRLFSHSSPTIVIPLLYHPVFVVYDEETNWF